MPKKNPQSFSLQGFGFLVFTQDINLCKLLVISLKFEMKVDKGFSNSGYYFAMDLKAN
jgi:hypothetical protein